jgi:biotin transport system substrate-specific component
MGYLVGFLSACYLASFVKLNDSFFKIFVKLTLAVSTVYIFGVAWLGTLIGWDKPILSLGVTPFLLAEIFKIILLSILAKKLVKLKNLSR